MGFADNSTEDLKVVYKQASKLIPYALNSRTHSDDQITQVASSIQEFGFTNPILIDEQCGIIAGHGRLMASKKLGIENVPTITLAGLSEAQKKAYVIADNQLAINAGWDLETLKVEVDRLNDLAFDLDLLGFSDGVLADLANLIEPDFDPASEDDQGKLDELDPKWINCPHCGKEFDMRAAV